MLGQEIQREAPHPVPVKASPPKSAEEISEEILQILLSISHVQKLRVWLCVKQLFLIVALNNYETVLKGKLTPDDVLRIAASDIKNCQLLVNSIYFPTLEKPTQDVVRKILRNHEIFEARMSSQPSAQPHPPSTVNNPVSP